jgi:hypothetical protein
MFLRTLATAALGGIFGLSLLLAKVASSPTLSKVVLAPEHPFFMNY